MQTLHAITCAVINNINKNGELEEEKRRQRKTRGRELRKKKQAVIYTCNHFPK